MYHVIAHVGEESTVDVKKETMSLAAHFRPVGEVLGLQASELNKISKNCPCDCEEAFSRVIDTWLKQSYDVSRHSHPSWKKLCEAVASGAGAKNPALAMKIADAHRGKMIIYSCDVQVVLIIFVASRKRRHNSTEGDPQPKRPRIEDGDTSGMFDTNAQLHKCTQFMCRSPSQV